MGLIHIPAGVDARLHTEGTNQSGIAFEVHHADFTIASQTQILSGNVHDYGEPLPFPLVPEHQKTGIFGKEMLALYAVDFRYVGFQFTSVHNTVIPKSRLPSARPEQKPSSYPPGTPSRGVPSYARD